MKVASNCEKEFVTKCIDKHVRLDGRAHADDRSIEILFGQEWGCCVVVMGKTRALSQVSAFIGAPNAATPTEGALYLHLEPSSMSAPKVQNQSRMSIQFAESQRILERCVRDSKCIDLESLCIVAGSKVWMIRVDIHILNDDGNIIECASIAAISALAHFKRPDVSVVGTNVTIDSLDDREPVPLNLHHMPIIVNLALFDQGEHILVDPLSQEERIADGCYIIGMNIHQEICLVHRRGVLLLPLDTIKRCENTASKRCQELTQIIRKALEDDFYKKSTKTAVGIENMINIDTILGAKYLIQNIDLHDISSQNEIHAEEYDMDVM